MTSEARSSRGRARVVRPSDERLRIVVREALGRAPLDVDWAEDARALAASLATSAPALVLVEAGLPGAEDAVRAASRAGVATLAIVEATDPGGADRALEWGASEVLRTPFPWRLLANRAALLIRGGAPSARSRAGADGDVALVTRLTGVSPWRYDPDDQRVRTTEQALASFGVGRTGPVRLEALLAWVDPEDRDALVRALNGGARRDGAFALDVRVTLPDRTERILHWQGEVPRGADRHPRGIVRDVTQERRAAARPRCSEYHDPLTGALSRDAFFQELDRAVLLARRHDRLGALLLLDLDGFRAVNDERGHETGDRVLQEVTRRLFDCVRQTDYVSRAGSRGSDGADGAEVTGDGSPDPGSGGSGGATIVSRLGGDEFTLLLTDLARPEDAARVARRLVETLRLPIPMPDGALEIGASIGLTIYPRDAVEADKLLACAHSALERARQAGRNQHQFYERIEDPNRARRLTLERKVVRAFENGEFQLHYQPQVDIESGEVLAFEALLRWTDSEWGALSPAEFVPVAEAAGMIEAIGEWGMREAARQLCAWRAEGLRPVRMSLNVSPRHFRGDRLLRAVNQVLWDTDLDPEDLEFEITENAFMENQEAAVAIASELKRIGVSVALDDFGTGYSSLSHLRRFPVDCLKIDRSFIADLSLDPENAAITAAILSMARALRLRVIAEGVETEKQRQFLKARGCREIQGFLFSPAVPPAEAARWLRTA